MTRVYPRHVRAAKLCMGGARQWASTHGFAWNEFVSHGLPAETLSATGDPFAERAVAAAEAEQEQ